MSVLFGFIALFGLILLNVPIAVAIGLVAIVGMVVDNGVVSVYNAALTLFDGATNFPLIAIPLFILAGCLMNTTSISRRLIDFCLALVTRNSYSSSILRTSRKTLSSLSIFLICRETLSSLILFMSPMKSSVTNPDSLELNCY